MLRRNRDQKILGEKRFDRQSCVLDGQGHDPQVHLAGSAIAHDFRGEILVHGDFRAAKLACERADQPWKQVRGNGGNRRDLNFTFEQA